MGNEKHTLQDLASVLTSLNKSTRSKNDAFVRSMFGLIKTALDKDGFVKIKGFGTFKIIVVNSRESVDVNTGERIEIQEHQRLTFVPDKTLKERVNRPFEAFETTIIEDDSKLSSLNFNIPSESDYNDDEVFSIKEETLVQENVIVQDEVRTVPLNSSQENIDIKEEELKDKEFLLRVETLDLDADVHKENAPDSILETATEDKDVIEHVSDGNLLDHEERPESDAEIEDLEKMESQYLSLNIQEEISELADEEDDNHEKKSALIFLLGILGVIILCCGSYIAGYYHLIDIDSLLKNDSQVSCDSTTTILVDTIVADSVVFSQDSTQIAALSNDVEKEEELSKDFEQMSDGEYLIVGVKEEHIMRVGDSLLKLAIKNYGNKSFVQYIIFFNKIENPDIIPLGALVKLPELKKKVKI